MIFYFGKSLGARKNAVYQVCYRRVHIAALDPTGIRSPRICPRVKLDKRPTNLKRHPEETLQFASDQWIIIILITSRIVWERHRSNNKNSWGGRNCNGLITSGGPCALPLIPCNVYKAPTAKDYKTINPSSTWWLYFDRAVKKSPIWREASKRASSLRVLNTRAMWHLVDVVWRGSINVTWAMGCVAPVWAQK